MREFDPESSDVNPRSSTTPKTKRTRQSDQSHDSERRSVHNSTPRILSVFNSKLTRFLGFWAIVTILLVQTVKLFSQSFSFRDNYSGILAVTFVITIGLRYMTTPNRNLSGVVAFGVVFEKLSEPIRRVIGTAWTCLLLGFILVFIGQCSKNPNIPIEDVFIISLDTYWTWLGQFWSKLLWYFGWN